MRTITSFSHKIHMIAAIVEHWTKQNIKTVT